MTDLSFPLPTTFAAYDDGAMAWHVFAKPLWTGGIHRRVAVCEREDDARLLALELGLDDERRQAALDNA